jgi:hypothetical protein
MGINTIVISNESKKPDKRIISTSVFSFESLPYFAARFRFTKSAIKLSS